MFPRDIIFLVKICTFHEMIISDNTERGSIKLTCCSCRKKAYETEIIYQQRNAEIQNKTYIWAEVFFFLTCDQAFVFFLSFGLDPVTTQSNHLLGNPWYTLMERLLANLTHLRFVFGFCLARKKGFESVWFSETFHLNTRYRSNFKDFAAWPFWPVPGRVWFTLRLAISHAHNAHGALHMKDYYGISQKFLVQRIMNWLISRKL